MPRKKHKKSKTPAGRMWHVRVTKEVRKPFNETSKQRLTEAVILVAIDQQEDQALNELEKVKHSRSKYRAEHIAEIEAELEQLNFMREQIGAYFATKSIDKWLQGSED